MRSLTLIDPKKKPKLHRPLQVGAVTDGISRWWYFLANCRATCLSAVDRPTWRKLEIFSTGSNWNWNEELRLWLAENGVRLGLFITDVISWTLRVFIFWLLKFSKEARLESWWASIGPWTPCLTTILSVEFHISVTQTKPAGISERVGVFFCLFVY